MSLSRCSIGMVMPSGWWQDGVTKISRGMAGGGSRFQPASLTRSGLELRARRNEGRAGAVIAGLLHPHGVAVVDEDPRQQVERRLRAVGDDDLLGLALHAARRRQIAGDRLAQRRISLDVIGAEQVVMGELGAAAEQARPGVEREIVGVGHARMERQHARLAVVIGLRQHDLPARRDRIARPRPMPSPP